MNTHEGLTVPSATGAAGPRNPDGSVNHEQALELARVIEAGELDRYTAVVEARRMIGHAVDVERTARDGSPADRRTARVQLSAAWAHLHEVQRIERERFAKTRGWRVAKLSYTYVDKLSCGKCARNDCGSHYPAIDHPDCFNSDRRPVAILSHSYGTWEQCTAFAAQHGLTAERLPWSWYFPWNCIAVLYTRGAP